MELQDDTTEYQGRYSDVVGLKPAEYVEKKNLRKYKVACAVLLCALVVVSLGLGLGLGLNRGDQEQVSCRHKCGEPRREGVSGCWCDSGCRERRDCCWDYEDTCLEPTRSWRCTTFRCGETRIPGSFCSCSDDCLQQKDCCVNYNSVCKGEAPWAEEPCASLETPQCPAGFDLPPLILFSMDGFRAEYLQTWASLLPNIEKLKTCGTHPKYMRAVYPTKTFPNHYTIVTGLYPESHGIIDNNMYDVNLNQHFSLSGTEKFEPSWWKGQPVWLTAMYQNLKAGTFFWPGSDVPINGTYPTLFEVFNGSVIYEQRISGILKWLDYPKSERPDFYTLYIEEPDSSGHSFGPVSGGVIRGLQAADQALGMLMDGLKQRNLHNCVNLIVLADHGMEKTYCTQLEYMTNYFQQIDFYIYAGPAARIRARNVPKDYFTFDSEGIVKNLTNDLLSRASKPRKRELLFVTFLDSTMGDYPGRVTLISHCKRSPQHFKPYLTPDLPKRFHYANNIRIDKVHLLVDRQWLAVRDRTYTYCDGGNHGYDNEFKSMEAIFLGYGPSFKEKTEVDAFENIEVYNLLCDLLHITPAPNNGTHGSLNHLLKKPFYNPSHANEDSSPSSCPVSRLTPIDDLGCKCTQISNVSAINARLNLTTGEINVANSHHLPYGRPKVLQKENVYCLLFHRQYVSGYSHNIWMPLWTAYTVNKPYFSFSTAEQRFLEVAEADRTDHSRCLKSVMFTCYIRISLNYLKTEAEEKHWAENISVSVTCVDLIHCENGRRFNEENTSPLPPTVSDCLRADVRIPVARSQNCSNYPEELPFARSFLYPPNFISPALDQYDALLTSNIVPMYRAFRDIWDHFHDVLLQEYARERNGVNVVSGPVFDYNYDGHFDTLDEIKQHVNNTEIPVPTHYFVVLTSCKNKSYTPVNCSGSLDVSSFILPHRPDNTESCAENKTLSGWVEERVQAHAARVRDVELLTGLDFYQEREEPISEILQLKTFLPTFETEIN